MNLSEKREWTSFVNDGQALFGIVHRPITESKVPAVLFCQGFRGDKCGKNRLYVSLAQQMARLGILVLRFDYRGSGDSEGEFHQMTLDSQVQDTLKALEWLKNDEQVDKDRIGLLGRSLGAVVGVKVASLTEDIKSLALWAPVFSCSFWKDLWELTQDGKKRDLSESQRKELHRLSLSLPSKTFLDQFFQLNLSHDLVKLDRVPLLLIHGEKDAVVSIEQSESYMRIRQFAKGLTRFVRLHESEHDFSHLGDQKKAILETSDWFFKTLR